MTLENTLKCVSKTNLGLLNYSITLYCNGEKNINRRLF